MRALLIIAHGSRRPEYNDEVRALAARVAAEGSGFDAVRAAFLEAAQPSIPEGLAECAAAGATEIVAFPYFLAAGRHVATDIPAEIETFRARHPRVAVRLAPHLGVSGRLPGAILDLVGERAAS